MSNSRQKGKRGELEVARLCRQQGYAARRTAQYCGNTGDASDVTGLPGIHVEVKRAERLRLDDALSQAVRDSAGSDDLPAVFHRANEAPWKVTMLAEDWFVIYRQWEVSRSQNSESQ